MNYDDNILFSQSGGIDTDSTARAVQKGDYRMLEYCRLGQVSGEGATIITSLGTIEINNPDITALDRIVGTGIWQKEYSIVYLVYKDSAPDEIWQYEIVPQTHTLLSASDEYNFDPATPFYHVDVVDDIMKFTDGRWNDAQWDEGQRLFNPPYQLNLRKAKDGEYPVIDLQVIDAIKWPPLAPTCSYGTDQARADNKLRRQLFRFRVQYIYENSEPSAWSLWSNLALPTESEFVSGNNWPDSSQDNFINVSFNTGPDVVKKINLAVLSYSENAGGAETEFGLFLQIDKFDQSIANDSVYTYQFYGNVSSKPISNAEKNFDRLPITADCQSAIDSTRIVYSSFREGYDKPKSIDITASYQITGIRWVPMAGPLIDGQFVDASNEFILRSDYDITIFPFQAGMNFSFGNIDFGTANYTISEEDIANALLEATIADQNTFIFQVMGDAIATQLGFPTGTVTGFYQYTTSFAGTGNWAFTMLVNRQTLVTPSLKVGARHEFCITYGDRAQRDSTAITSPSMVVSVPWYSDIDTSSLDNPYDPFTVTANLLIDSVPPIYANKYWIGTRKTNIADFSQWVVNATPSGSSTVSAFVAEGSRYVISLDKYYLERYTGATINHTPQKGDVARFVRGRLSDNVTADPFPYIDTFFELEVQEYRPSGGNDGRAAIVVERFDLTLLDPDTFTCQVIEIYTPTPTLDTDGNLFVAQWRDCTVALPILNPYTSTRAHSGSYGPFGSVDASSGGIGQPTFATMVDLSAYVGDPSVHAIVFTNDNGDVQEATTLLIIDFGGGLFKGSIDTDFIYDFTLAAGGRFAIRQDQTVIDGISTLAATLNLDYGDVYVRQRNYATGYGSGGAGITNAFWFIEDPHYSDYWLSDFHQLGRIALEDPYAKMIDRYYSAIHSEVFFPDTQINGLSSFSFIDPIVQDVTAKYGRIVRSYESGRENKTLKLIQQQKENSVYINHYPSEALPEGSLVINKTSVFSAWYPYKQRYGANTAGATALWPDGTTYYFDVINGVFIQSGVGGQVVISEIDPDTGRDGKFRKKTKELTARFQNDSGAYIRTYVDLIQNEVGFCFAFTNVDSPTGYDYEIYTLDVLSMRFRTRYTYNFIWFENFGQTLIGFGDNNQLYLHNQDSVTFHGENFTERIIAVTNADPLRLKRFQNIIQRANKTYNVIMYAEPNESYAAMATEMPSWLFDIYEGYSKTAIRQNRFSPLCATEEIALVTGEDMRAHSLTMELYRDTTEDIERSILFAIEIIGVLN